MDIRRSTFVAACALGTAAALPAQSIDPHCTDPAIVGAAHTGGDACQKVADLFNYMNMQLGTWVAGGNPTLGQGGTLGGLGHFSVGVRANVMKATIPKVNDIQVHSGPPVLTNIPSSDKWVGLPSVDVAVGLFKGFPIGVTNIGGVDALGWQASHGCHDRRFPSARRGDDRPDGIACRVGTNAARTCP